MPVDPFSLDPPSSLLCRAAFAAARPLLSRVARFDVVGDVFEQLQSASSAIKIYGKVATE